MALILFAAISAIFFQPQYEGKALRQGDMVQVSGMSRDIEKHVEEYGEHPQWTGGMFSGMPAYLISMNYDGRWVKNVVDHIYFLGTPAAFLFVAMAGFYLMLLMFGVNPWIAIVGGVGYGLSSYFPIIIEAGHITKMMALAWVAPIVGSVWYAYRKNRYLGAALAGIFASVEISTSHPQITYYFLFVLLALVINELVQSYKEKRLRKFTLTTLTLLGAAILAIGSNLVQLYYVADHAPDTLRGASELTEVTTNTQNHTSGLDKDYATAWSYGKAETFNLFIPNFMGGSSSGGFASDGAVAESLGKYNARGIATQLPAYFGSQPFTSGPVYVGAILIFLFLFGLFFVEGRAKWWIVAVTILSLMLAWGHNMMWFSDLFLDYIPMYNKFRTVSTILVIVQWSVPLLAMLALQKFISGNYEKAEFVRAFKFSTLIAAGFAIFAAVVIPSFMDFTASSDSSMGLPDDVIIAMESERASLLRADAMRSLIFVAAAAALLWISFMGKLKTVALAGALSALVVADLFGVDRRYVKTEDFRPKREALAIPMTDADRTILQDTTNYRVMNLTVSPFQDATTSYYHRSVGGYHAAKLRRYQDIIEKHLSQNNMAVYDMLNTKYFIVQGEDGKASVQVNSGALGNAWFVDQIQWVDTPDQEIIALGEGFSPRHTAVIDRRFESELTGINPSADSLASITLTEYKVNHLTYHSKAAAEGVAIFSEVYYAKGWKAYIDGVEVPYLRADYILRAMKIPSGEHTIEWRFAAPHFETVVNLTRASSAILLLAALAMLSLSVCCKKTKEGQDQN